MTMATTAWLLGSITAAAIGLATPLQGATPPAGPDATTVSAAPRSADVTDRDDDQDRRDRMEERREQRELERACGLEEGEPELVPLPAPEECELPGEPMWLSPALPAPA
ncbi:hypothetical protein ACFWPA_03595 [Rhodococcus sp. NPDC058505]|uniref:hypothetical protein n=1 Tax=Rhodococcus sp. NPDC058505 TaxID=3346531 RepID=UPI00365971E4